MPASCVIVVYYLSLLLTTSHLQTRTNLFQRAIIHFFPLSCISAVMADPVHVPKLTIKCCVVNSPSVGHN